MPDRSPEEREAARRERELRRAEREGRAPSLPPLPDPPSAVPDSHSVAEPPSVPDPRAVPEPPSVPDPSPASGPGPVASDGAGPGRASPAPRAAIPIPADPIPGHVNLAAEPPDEDGYDFETGEHEFESEAPSGTRRVSRRESMGREPPRRRGRRRAVVADGGERRHSWLGRIVSLIALVIGAALIWFLIETFQPFQGSPYGRITVVIPAHSTSSQVGDLLARDKVISSSFFFEVRATLAGDRGSMRAGTYHLQYGMSYGSVLTALTTPPPAAKVTEVTITEGRTRQYISARLRAEKLGRGNYLAATRRSPLINLRAYGLHKAPPSLEGFLYPDTYQLIEPVSINALVRDQLIAFKQNFARVNLVYAKRRHLSPYDVLKIASLIEAEAATQHDRPLVASVIYNRLADGMMLQFDSTTRYATGNFTKPLTVSQLHSPSPWNTHTHFGLPLTPIDSPGLAAIQAAAHPAHTNYLFFFTRHCGNGTVYTSNYSRFLTLDNQDLARRC